MYGAIIGDIIGSWTHRESAAEDFDLFREASKFTEETVLTAAVAEGLLEAGQYAGKDEITRSVRDSIVRWTNKYPDAGFPQSFAEWCRKDKDVFYLPLNVPPAFHISPAGWLYETLERTREVSDAVSLATHRYPSYAEHAGAVSEAVYMARTGASKEEIKEVLNKKYDFDLSADPGCCCMENYSWWTVTYAFKAFMDGNNFWDAVKKSGCSQIASIAGAIAEAYWGVPASALDRMKKIIPDEILKVLDRFAATLGRDGAVDPAWEEIAEETAGNDAVVDAIRSCRNGEREIADVYEAVRLQLIREKFLAVPTEYKVPSVFVPEGATISDLVGNAEKPEEHIRTFTDSDGAEWCIAFTDREHRDAWEKAAICSISYRVMLEHVVGSEKYAGLILNPGKQQMLLRRRDVSLILRNSFSLDWTKEDKAEEKQNSEDAHTLTYMLPEYKALFKGNEVVFGKLASESMDAGDDDGEKLVRLMSGICRQALRNRFFIAAVRDGIPSGTMIVNNFKLVVPPEELDSYLLQLYGEKDGMKWTAVPVYSSPESANKAGLINHVLIPIGELLRCVKTWPEDKFLAVDLDKDQRPLYIGHEMAEAMEENFLELIRMHDEESNEDKAAILKDMYDAPFEGNEYLFDRLAPAAMKPDEKEKDHNVTMLLAAFTDQMKRKKCLILPAKELPAEFGALTDAKLAIPPEELLSHIMLIPCGEDTVLIPSFTNPSYCPEGLLAMSIFVPIDEVLRFLIACPKDHILIFNPSEKGYNPFYINHKTAESLLRLMDMQEEKNRQPDIRVMIGDITKTECVDAVVNTANAELSPLGVGVNRAVHIAAGPKLAKACARLSGCRCGEAKITEAFGLPCKAIIHTVAPSWNKGEGEGAELLAECYINCLKAAANAGMRSIAFPSIGTGVRGFPIEEAARIAVRTVQSFLSDEEAAGCFDLVTWVVLDSRTAEIYKHELDQPS